MVTNALVERIKERWKRRATAERARISQEMRTSPQIPEKREEQQFEIFSNLETSPSRERMRSPNAMGSRPHRGLNLKPLIRWLQAQIGEPWDTVWSKLSVHPTLKKVKEHASHLVPSIMDPRGMQYLQRRNGWLYRDEADVIRVRFEQQPEPPTPQSWWTELPTGEIAAQVKGIWYAFTTRAVESSTDTVATYYSDSSNFFRGKIGDFFRKEYRRVMSEGGYHYNAPVIHEIIGKRQLGSTELKKYGLRAS